MLSSGADVQQSTAAASDPAIQDMLNRIRGRAEVLHNLPREDYNRPRVAPLQPETVRARELANQTGHYEPYLEEARAVSNRARQFPQAYKEYMQPYVHDVVKRLNEEGNQSIERKIKPMLDAKFARLGQYGSTRHQKALAEAIEDVQKDISAQQQKALFTGYAHAGDIFGKDRAQEMERAKMLSQLGVTAGAGRESDIKALQESGHYKRQHEQMMRDAAYQEWLRKNNYEWDTLNKWLMAQQGLPFPSTQTNMGIQPLQPTLNTAGSAGVMGAHLLGMAMQPTAEQMRQAALAQARIDGFL